MADTLSLRPILVTGGHRSGTTWVGKMLAAGPDTAYISEPLNVLHRPGVYRAAVEHWYTYIVEENEADYLPAFQELLDFDYHLLAEIRSIRSRRDLLRMLRDFGVFYMGSMRGQRAVLKDPFAVFSAAWFADRLDCRVVITVRHPAGFASSLKRLNWPFDFRNLLGQPLLLRDYLGPDRAAMENVPPEDLIGQAALLWRLIYQTVHRLRIDNPDFIVVRQEDLARDPVPGFTDLYRNLGLDFNPQVERAILASSSPDNPAESSRNKIHSVKIDSRANVDSWRKHLEPDEIGRILRITGDVFRRFYPEDEWSRT